MHSSRNIYQSVSAQISVSLPLRKLSGMLRTAWASWGRNSSCTWSNIQFGPSSSMSAHTPASLGKFFYGETILLECLVGNHLSPQIRTILPSPIHQTALMRINSLAFKMLGHAYDPLVLTSLSITEQFGKNFALKTLWKRDSGLWMRHHSCFPSIARLKFSKSLKPKLPWFFGK